jgi:superfamily II DNA or RNA helicase/HKD family nuclease
LAIQFRAGHRPILGIRINFLETKSKLSKLSFEPLYITGKNNPLENYLVPALAASENYSRAVGYFSSAIMAVLAEAFTDFAERGGKMRLICSPFLSIEDASVLKNESLSNFEAQLESSLVNLSQDVELKEPLSLMAYLIRSGCLEIKIAIPEPGTFGLFHHKIGYFRDSEDNVSSFIGSNNETLRAWAANQNGESFTVLNSWALDNSEVCEKIIEQFESYWQSTKSVEGFKFINFADAVGFFHTFDTESGDVSELKKSVRNWVKDRSKRQNGSDDVDSSSEIKLRDYQILAFENWEKCNFAGVVSFATGAGKTITALNCIEKWMNKGDDYGTLILVPSVNLQAQWVEAIVKNEYLSKFLILLAGGAGSSSNWKSGLNGFSSGKVGNRRTLIIAVMDTASKKAFVDRTWWREKLLVVADEMHNLGAPSFQNLLEKIEISSKLGLSATPQRYDETETHRLREVFGDDLEPVVDIAYAQKLGVLTKYLYYPLTCELSSVEEEDYVKVSAEISKTYAMLKSSRAESSQLKAKYQRLLQIRAKIIKKASSKLAIAEKTLRANLEKEDYWLIFFEDSIQLEEFRSRILDLHPLSLHQKMEGDVNATLDAYSKYGGIMLAIKMFDEGVDIPAINKSIVVASSSNRRQYIQRRGRILRANPMKAKIAKIWDFVVVNKSDKVYLDSEIDRTEDFFQDAMNKGNSITFSTMKNSTKIEGM